MTELPRGPAKSPAPVASGLNLADIYYTLFRHWRMIVLFAVLGIGAAGAVYFLKPPVYTSEAKLLIRYILDKRNINPTETGAKVTSPDDRGENIMNTEVEILSSFDLALKVADAIGPEKVLAKAGGGTNRFTAAGLIRKGTLVENPRRSNILRIVFSHPDPKMIEPILQSLVTAYLNKHVEIHRNTTVIDEVLRRQRDALSLALSDTENQLRSIRTNYGIISIEDSKRTVMDQFRKISDELVTAEAQLAEAVASVKGPGSLTITNPPSGTNSAAATNLVVIPEEQLKAYQRVVAELDSLRKHEKELRAQFTERHPSFQRLRPQLAEAEQEKQRLETQYPEIARYMPAMPSTATTYPSGTPSAIAVGDGNRIPALQARVSALKAQLEQTQKATTALVEAEIRMTGLQRDKDIKEGNLRYYQSSLDQAVVDEALGPGKVMNISVVQAPPEVPGIDTKGLMKQVAIALFGPLAFGFVLAFLLDLFLDPSIKRASEVERRIHLPLIVSFPNNPQLSPRSLRRLLPSSQPKELPPVGNGNGLTTEAAAEPPALAPAFFQHLEQFRPFFETLRDRLVMLFEARNLTHKPKLVAVTSCHREAGVTTVAAGLAALLSETGDGNVLLVDMNVQGGAVRHFFSNDPGLHLMDALDDPSRNELQVRDRLFVVAEHEFNGDLPRSLPKRFGQLVPRLKLTDYDYIIFELPHMSQTSITPRVAHFMDVVLLVAEAEKTNRDMLQQSAKILTDNGATVCAVLNKARSYVPQSLSHELT